MDELATARLNRLIKRAAKSVIHGWALDAAYLDDLVQDMWTEYLSKPSNQRLMDRLDDRVVSSLRRMAEQLLSGQRRDEDVAAGSWLYSSELIKDALKGRGLNPGLESIIPSAVTRLEDRHPPYAEALKLRYIDGQIPEPGADQVRLSRAHQALAESLHELISDHNAEIEGPGSRGVVFPDTIKPKGGDHPDPTGDAAAHLADEGDKIAEPGLGLTHRQVWEDMAASEPVATDHRPVRYGTQVCWPCHHIVPVLNGLLADHLAPACAGSGQVAV